MTTEWVNCFKCKHFYITWDKRFPNGCKVFGFKSKQLPSQVVREAIGGSCTTFQKKEPPANPDLSF
jgi:hypothetical protein